MLAQVQAAPARPAGARGPQGAGRAGGRGELDVHGAAAVALSARTPCDGGGALGAGAVVTSLMKLGRSASAVSVTCTLSPRHFWPRFSPARTPGSCGVTRSS